MAHLPSQARQRASDQRAPLLPLRTGFTLGFFSPVRDGEAEQNGLLWAFFSPPTIPVPYLFGMQIANRTFLAHVGFFLHVPHRT